MNTDVGYGRHRGEEIAFSTNIPSNQRRMKRGKARKTTLKSISLPNEDPVVYSKTNWQGT
jgi:hypothetical protein